VAKSSSDGAAATRSGIPVRRAALMPEQIVAVLRKDIVENRWKSGERLPEPQLCGEFGVSRTPLREAFKRLEAEGLIRLIPHVGAVVTDPDAAEIAETMEILIALEQLATTRLAQKRPSAVIAEIERIDREMLRAARAKDAPRYYELNDEFHRTIVGGTGNKALIDLHQTVMWDVHRERHRANAVEPFTVPSPESHQAIMTAVRAGDGAKAGLAMRDHLENVSRTTVARRKEQEAGVVVIAAAKPGRRKSRSTRVEKAR
jgi:DNA-binding GntR family transcriptional regulator